ncbi:MAG TPA: DNA polymerase III subunit beta [Chitinophagaceae bacterium]|mgnify:CR=1 FL=1|nr:DNA polymerase III subunit beta [Chitinophagaceae bacterium]
MKFIVSSGTLLKNLQSIGGIISSNNVLPILESFLFILKKDQLTVVSTDLETMMKVNIDVTSNDEGSLCIQAKVLQDYLKNLPEQPITFDISKSDYGIDITSEQGKYKIVGEDSKSYPTEPKATETSSFTMSAAELGDGIAKAIIAVSNDDLRPAMSGVFFELSKNNLTLVATDAHRLVRCVKTDVSCQTEDKFIVPKKALIQLKNNLNTSTEVKLSFNSNHLFVEGEHINLSCRLIDAKFPDYKVVIPADNPYKLTINKNEFVSALRRVSVFANKTTNQVVLDIVGNSLHLYAQDVDFSFEGNEQLPAQYTGEDMKIAFNARLLLELILVIEGEEVLFELSTPTRAGLVKPTEKRENEDLLMLLMPLMIGA